jgi:hypothetical protein
VGTDGRLAPYATGALITASNGSVLWAACDDAGYCTYRLGTADAPDTAGTTLETNFLYASVMGGEGQVAMNALAPDGATIVAQIAPDATTGISDGRPKIVDLKTGSTIDLSGLGYQSFAWTPDGDWVVEVTPGGELAATNVRSARKLTVAFPGLVDLRAPYTGLVIG